MTLSPRASSRLLSISFILFVFIGFAASRSCAEPPLLTPGMMPVAGDGSLPASGPARYELKLYHHLHTGESLNIVYRIGDTYIPSALEQLNYFLRGPPYSCRDVSSYDPSGV